MKRIIKEKIEGLPDSYDPYAPMTEVDHEGEIKGEDDVDLDEDLDDPEEDEGIDLGFDDDELGIGEEDTEEDYGKDKTPYWEPIELPNKKDIGFKRSDGFYLRARRLESVPNKWIAQIWAKDKILDKGSIFIEDDLDPGEYLQKVSDYMLDHNSRRYTQQRMFPLEPEDEEVNEIVPEEEPKEAEEDDLNFDLDDEDFQLEQ
jgi:hypothetical protein